jgi:phage baseplate assembly protein W
MVILDQLEEYFLYHPQDDAFAQEFPRAVMQADAPVSFLIAIREDSVAKLDRFEGRIEPKLVEAVLEQVATGQVTLDAVMSTLLPNEQDIAASVFHYLVTPSGTKIAHTIHDLIEYAGLPQMRLVVVK